MNVYGQKPTQFYRPDNAASHREGLLNERQFWRTLHSLVVNFDADPDALVEEDGTHWEVFFWGFLML